MGQSLHDDAEFIVTDASDCITLPGGGVQQFCHQGQNLISDGMAKGIVDVFEPVQVEHQKRQLLFSASGVCDGHVEAVAKQLSVGQFGQ